MASFLVVYDTCVLVPAPLRDLLLRVAEAGLVRASMSDDILDELQRVLARELGVGLGAVTPGPRPFRRPVLPHRCRRSAFRLPGTEDPLPGVR